MSSTAALLVFGAASVLGKKPTASKHFSPDDIHQITESTTQAEQGTSAEIRVAIDENVRETSIDEHVQNRFTELGIANTSRRTGILVIFLIHEKTFRIVPDSGILAAIAQSEWDQMKFELVRYFSAVKGYRDYARAIAKIIEEVGKRLASVFPKSPDDVDELPDSVSLA